jgi:hypothetical protein
VTLAVAHIELQGSFDSPLTVAHVHGIAYDRHLHVVHVRGDVAHSQQSHVPPLATPHHKPRTATGTLRHRCAHRRAQHLRSDESTRPSRFPATASTCPKVSSRTTAPFATRGATTSWSAARTTSQSTAGMAKMAPTVSGVRSGVAQLPHLSLMREHAFLLKLCATGPCANYSSDSISRLHAQSDPRSSAH